MPEYILVIEDEPAIQTLLQYNLTQAGYETTIVESGEDGLTEIAYRIPDCILLDWMLPGLSGLDFCRHIRKNEKFRTIPVIMLTARGEETDMLRGLDHGADDYITKPFSPKNLLARVQALLRRSNPERYQPTLKHGGVIVDKTNHQVLMGNSPIHCSPTEYRMLVYFLENKGRILNREQLLSHVWGDEKEIDTRTVDVHIGRLRKLLGNDFIRTIRSEGYSLGSVEI